MRLHFPHTDDWSTRTMIEVIVALLLLVTIGIGTAALVGLASAVDNDTAGRQSDHRTIQSLHDEVSGLQATAKSLAPALQNAESLLARRSPSLQFFVCAYAKEADFIQGAAQLGRNPTANQLKAFGIIAAGPRKALTPTTDGGCLDPTIPVIVPLPVTVPAS